MLIFLYRQFFGKFFVLAIALGSCCVCALDNLSDTTQLAEEHTYPVDNEVNAVTDNPTTLEPFEPERLLPYLVPGESCNRVCVSGQKRVCHFEFNLEYYQVMGAACGQCAEGVEKDCNNPQCIVADGVEKGAMSINRQIPGPAIQACKDDVIVVDVHNHADGSAAAFHWHGLHMRKTPFMDGVPFLTQCPIPYSTSFRYYFVASEPGTQFYHSHSGHHKSNGQYGALIIRQADDPLQPLYDHDLPEHHIIISDWMHQYAEQQFPGLPSTRTLPDSVLINGRGIFTDPATKQQTNVRPVVFYVQPSKRYRFRLINSVNHVCAFQMQIEKHNLTVIATDSYNLLPFTVDTLVSNAGERYDFVLTTNHTSGDFWLRVRGLGSCSEIQIESYVLIRYKINEADDSENGLEIPPFPKYEETYPLGTNLNHPLSKCNGEENNHCVTKLRAFDKDDDLLNSTPDYKFFLAFQNHQLPIEEVFKPGQYRRFSNIGGKTVMSGAFNSLALTFPDFPPLTQPDLIDKFDFCNNFTVPEKCANRTVCPCTHRLVVNLNSTVELIIVDESGGGIISHPFHLHGHRYMVTGMGHHPDGLPMNLTLAREMEEKHLLIRNFVNDRPPFKDTVSIPTRGYAIIRFRATNPGFWLLHCHYEWHLATGMGLIFQAGDPTEMVEAPSDFPKCGNYLTPIGSSITSL